ncbi:tyrosine-type recombinase/integrase [Microbacterium testaceum]|uniref:Core-binding (CB) domain-containing protein n=1 Tax=Microbacterium testaceum TaxID=2033 RepID=A0A2T7WLF5_MICTE|nr:site-specific integrase [Microbacterium testaceum]PVE73761.1 hypothetical protein DC432_07420 [Microbacterium testaceum]
MTTDDVGAADRKKHAAHKRQPRRAICGMGSVHVRELPAPNGGVYTYYRAVRRIKLGSKTVTVAVQRKTAADAARALEEAVTRKRVAYGQLGPEHLTVPEELSYVTVRDVMATWLETKNDDGDLAWQSYRMYDSRIRQHILPVFGDEPVRTLTYPKLRTFFKDTLPGKGLGDSSIRQVHIALKGALNVAQRDGIILAHPMVGIKAPDGRKKRTTEEVKELRQAAKYLNRYLLAEAEKIGESARWLLAMVGIRQSEVLGMTDDSLVTRRSGNTRTRRVVISHQLARVAGEHGCGEWDAKLGAFPCGRKTRGCTNPKSEAYWALVKTKSESGVREIVIPEHVWQVLVTHRAAQSKLRQDPLFNPVAGEGLDKLLFTVGPPTLRKDGNPRTKSYLGQPRYGQRDREQLYGMIEAFKKDSGLTVHSLRHVATTMLIEAGASRESLVATMGWSEKGADQQIATYSHNDRAKRAAGDVSVFFDMFHPAPVVAPHQNDDPTEVVPDDDEPPASLQTVSR